MPKRPSTISRPWPSAGDFAHRPAAATDVRAVGGRRVLRQPVGVAAEHDRGIEEPLPQPARYDERVAPVVAGAREYRDAAAEIAGHGTGDLGRGEAGALHQRLAPRRRLDPSQVGGAHHGHERRRSGHPWIIGRGPTRLPPDGPRDNGLRAPLHYRTSASR